MTLHITHVIKRDGQIQEFKKEKLDHWAQWASNELGIDWEDVSKSAFLRCENYCKTSDLQNAMIDACVDKESTAHQKMAGRLLIGDIYHRLFNGVIPSVKEQHERTVALGMVKKLEYSDGEWQEIEKMIDHSRDMKLKHSQVVQLCNKFGLKSAVTGELYETPQFLFMRQALFYGSQLPKERRLKDIKEIYNRLSQEKLCAPTPNHLYVGTTRGTAPSCVVVRSEDDLPSMSALNQAVWSCSATGSGLGASMSIRSPKDPVRNTTIEHNGKLEYYRTVMTLARANQQAGRSGAVTMHYTCLDPEVMDIARMRNPTTVDQKRLGEMDFSFGSNAAFADAVRENKDWMLVSVLYAPRLWELLYQSDKEKFLEEYAKVLADEKIPKKLVNARKILLTVLREAIETRQYEHFTDEMNRHTPFLDTIYSSNLCQEIFLPTAGYKQGQKGLDNVNPDEGGEIATCNLCGINVANIESDEDYELTAYYALLMIMINILTSHYPFKQMEETSISRMSAGVSILNLAHLMAKNGMKYSDMWGKKFIHRLAETHSYFLHKAALKLGKEFGNAKWIGKTKYPSGWLPIDTRNEKAKAIAHQPLKRDWETLRKEIVENGGIAFSVLETAVPSESSSIAQDSCNGLYPIREGIITKKDGKKVVQWIAPQWEELQDKYEKAFTISTKDMTDLYAIVQCFTGQGISADYYMAHKRDENGKIVVSGKQLIKDWLYRQEMGMKSRYYINHSTNGVYQQAEAASCSSGGCTL